MEADTMTTETQRDRDAMNAGYTRRVYIEGGCQGGEFLVQPDTDFDDQFRAWGLDWQSWTNVNGWACTIENVEAEA
jgi:hypothetical protein